MIVERLDPQRHARTTFTCGEPSLDRFLHVHARQYFDRGLGVTWVAVREADPSHIDGYYTLAMHALLADELQSSRVRLSRVPVLLLGRLAVACDQQGRGLGAHLLMHALHTAYHLSQLVGAHAIVVDPLNERAAHWYARYGFVPVPGAPDRLLLPVATLKPHVKPLSAIANAAELLALARDLTVPCDPTAEPAGA